MNLLYFLAYTVVLVQLRFGKLNCVDFSSTESIQKLNDITTAMIVNLNKICKCQMNSSFLLNSRLQCFDESQETVTFRTQLSATALASTTELMSYIEQWIESGDFLLNGVRLEFNTTCSLQISSFNADECPTSNRVTTVSPSTDIRTPVSGTVVGIILLAILLIICLITIVLLVGYIAVLKRKHTTHSKKGKRFVEGLTVCLCLTTKCYHPTIGMKLRLKTQKVQLQSMR